MNKTLGTVAYYKDMVSHYEKLLLDEEAIRDLGKEHIKEQIKYYKNKLKGDNKSSLDLNKLVSYKQ